MLLQILGAGLLQSEVLSGMVFKREVEGDVTSASKAKVAIYSCPIDITQTETKGTVLIKTADELLNFSKVCYDDFTVKVRLAFESTQNGGCLHKYTLHLQKNVVNNVQLILCLLCHMAFIYFCYNYHV